MLRTSPLKFLCWENAWFAGNLKNGCRGARCNLRAGPQHPPEQGCWNAGGDRVFWSMLKQMCCDCRKTACFTSNGFSRIPAVSSNICHVCANYSRINKVMAHISKQIAPIVVAVFVVVVVAVVVACCLCIVCCQLVACCSACPPPLSLAVTPLALPVSPNEHHNNYKTTTTAPTTPTTKSTTTTQSKSTTTQLSAPR